MSSKETTPSVTPVTPPVNPAKGNKRGQTTLAAEIDRWQALADNLAPQVEQMPALKDAFAQFQSVLATAKAVRNQINTLRANTDMAVAERQQMLVDGGNLYSRPEPRPAVPPWGAEPPPARVRPEAAASGARPAAQDADPDPGAPADDRGHHDSGSPREPGEPGDSR